MNNTATHTNRVTHNNGTTDRPSKIKYAAAVVAYWPNGETRISWSKTVEAAEAKASSKEFRTLDDVSVQILDRCDAADSNGSCGPATYTEINSTEYVFHIITRSACAAHVNTTPGWQASIVTSNS